jgi:hypothetical protein
LRILSVVQKAMVLGYTENRVSRTRPGIRRRECYPVLNHAMNSIMPRYELRHISASATITWRTHRLVTCTWGAIG